MLRELRVENLLLIERAQLRLAVGLNVITGETGAGKTVLAHALDLLLGGRARAAIVRPGAAEAYVEGAFDLPAELPADLRDRLPADAQEVVISRRVGRDGRTRAYLNGRAATVGELRELGSTLMTFYGQHEHRQLTLAAAQLQILDEQCGPEQALALRACGAAFARTRRLEGELDALKELAGARGRELDLLEFELAEIDALAPTAQEHEELLSARARLRRADALTAAAAAGADALAPESGELPGAAQLIGGGLVALDAVARVDGELDALGERLRGQLIEAQDLAGELRRYAEQAELGGPGAAGSLEQLEERLSAIDRLVRKHGSSVQAVLEHAARARARRDELAGAEVALANTERELAQAQAELAQQCVVLRAAREQAASGLARSVREQLAELAMPDASFEIVLGEREPGPSGADSVEFLIAPNPGVPRGPLREIASGGELSRVMLAIMGVAAAAGSPEFTLVFDEVDAGIGGHTARAVGARLRALAGARQVLCITHLPQIASLGERHFTIVKDTSADPTRARVLELGEAEVVAELVRMLGADPQDATARRHARELRRAA